MNNINSIKSLLYSIILPLLFFTTAASTYATLPPPSVFNDVYYSHINFDAINYIKLNNIVSGYSDGSFRPDNNITRAELIKILVTSSYKTVYPQGCIASNTEPIAIPTLPPGYLQTPDFPDMPKSHTLAGYVCIAKQNNIISGFSDGSFRPDDYIEFGAAAKIITNTMKLIPDQSNLSEVEKFKPYIEKLAEKKAIPTSINFIEQKLTRGELAEIIYRLKTGIQKESKVYQDFISVSIQGAADTKTPTQTPSPIKVTVKKPGQTGISYEYVCNCSKTCAEITTCSEAYYQFQSCGCLDIDTNKDSIPCENLCAK